jgi:hypothetical protein
LRIASRENERETRVDNEIDAFYCPAQGCRLSGCANLEVHMIRNYTVLALSLIAGSFGLSACGEAPTTSAPEVEDDLADVADFGSSYNGWMGSANGYLDLVARSVDLGVSFSRDYGDATRGGGACVITPGGGSCSQDSNCPVWYAGGYGYCMSGTCYQRPGSAADLCYQNPNNAPGSYYKFIPYVADTGTQLSLVVCMTKTAGPNTACGGTNSSLYMRTWGSISGN